jgi:UrcA family protein
MRVRASAMAIGACVGLALNAASAGAQDYASGPAEEVIVTPPPPQGPQRSAIGAPIVLASQSAPVRFDDLDLRTERGARDLRSRVNFAARTLCTRLSTLYPSSFNGVATGWPPEPDCYRTAVDSAMPGAEAAIDAARTGYGGR